MANKFNPVNNHNRNAPSERGALAVGRVKFNVVDGNALDYDIDTAAVGALSASISIDNTASGAVNLACSMLWKNHETGEETATNFMDKAGTDGSSLTINAATKNTIVLNYTDYPVAMAARYLVLRIDPASSPAAAYDVPIDICLK